MDVLAANECLHFVENTHAPSLMLQVAGARLHNYHQRSETTHALSQGFAPCSLKVALSSWNRRERREL